MSDVEDTLPLEHAGGGQIRPILAAAIEAMVTHGCSQREAAELSGMTEHGLRQALKKPHVIVYMRGVKRAWMDNATGMAWRTVAQLMQSAKSEDTRLKAARTVLEAAGELGGPDRDANPRAQAVINIVLSQGQSAPTQAPGGVIEAPMRNITPRQDRAQDVSINDE